MMRVISPLSCLKHCVAKSVFNTVWYFVIAQVIGRHGYWNSIFFGRPCTEIDLFAALGAEGTKSVLRHPFDLFSAARAINDRTHIKGGREASEIAECQFKRNVVLKGFWLHVAVLRGKTHPKHIFIGRYFRNCA